MSKALELSDAVRAWRGCPEAIFRVTASADVAWSRTAGKASAHPKDTAFVGFSRFAVRRAGHIEVAQVGTPKGHHGRVLDWKFDHPIEASVRRVSVQTSAAMDRAPVAAVRVEGASVWNSKLFRYFGKDPFAAELALLNIEFVGVDAAFVGVSDEEFPVPTPGEAIMKQTAVILLNETTGAGE